MTTRFGQRAVIALALAALVVPSTPASTEAVDTSTTVLASADGHVRSTKPNGNYSQLTTIRVRQASDAYTGYVQFSVQGLSDVPSRAVLRLFVTDASPDGGAIWPVGSAWNEATLTSSTAPAYSGAPVADLGRGTAGTWLEADVTSAVTGNGTFSFAIGPQSSNSTVYSSREGANPPQLVITSGSTTPPPAPTASFSASPVSGQAPLNVTFTDTSSGSPTSWAWDFDNNGTTDSTLQNPSFTYSSAGTYTVKLTAGNAGGSTSATRTNLISVTAPPTPPPAPTASFSASPVSGQAPLNVTFTDTSSGSPTSWAWDFDNNGTTDSTLQNPSFTYSSAGTYTVKLTAGNAGGSTSATRTNLISVTAPPTPPPDPGDGLTLNPVADAYLNESRPTSNYGPATTLRVRLSTDSYASLLKFTVAGLNAAPTSATLRLYVTDESPSGGRISTTANTWTESGVTWGTRPLPAATIGDLGQAATGSWISIDVTSDITGNGTYSFYLGGLNSNSVVYSSREGLQPPQLVINGSGSTPPPVAPTASFSASPLSGSAPLTVSFTDTSTGSPTSWAWDFDNNGTTDSMARNPNFTYTAAGTYTVKLTAINASGANSATQTNLISVTPPPPPDPDAAVLVGAGDIAKCTSTKDELTAALVESIPGTVFTAGDNVYEDGTAAEFANCYDPSWGAFKSRTRPTVGNHEYQTTGASGYYGYFGAAAGDPSKGYYSYDVGAWHVVALNSECTFVACGAGSVQEQWLRADLAAHPTACTMAIFHRPLFSSSSTTGSTSVRPLWQALYDNNAEVVVNGHAHIYERFAPQKPDGTLDTARGLRQFIVGTGGAAFASMGTIKPNSEVRSNTSFGVMKFTLRATGYDWQFVPATGYSLNDAGSGTCH